jgi:cell division septum initiation protein DivIVA
MSNDSDDKNLPLAELLRRRKKSSAEKRVMVAEKEDIDDEIKRLENELADGSSDSDSSDSGDDEPSDNRSRKVRFGGESIKVIPSNKPSRDQSEPSVICLSAVSEERIVPLPTASLPTISKKRSSSDDAARKAKKKKKSIVSDGLQEAVKEVLSGYVARSSEKLPFYCRVCAKQYSSKEEFFDHKNTDFHKTAVEMEKKASYCKLCQKQFTSPVQIKEHLTSRPHREKLQRVRQSQQRQPRNNRNGNGNRQWC